MREVRRDGLHTPIKDCDADPGCARYLACLDACPVSPTGDADPSCAAACSKGPSSSQPAVQELADCRTSGAGASCTACGKDSGSGGSPILHQSCQPAKDAGCTNCPAGCFSCEKGSCCDTYVACASSADCKALEKCIKDCQSGIPDDAGSMGTPPPDQSCDYVCSMAHPKGLETWAPRWACLSVFCDKPCGLDSDSCSTCLNEKCANEYVAVEGTPEGYLFDACFQGCPSGFNKCTNACVQMYPGTEASVNVLQACGEAQCPACLGAMDSSPE